MGIVKQNQKNLQKQFLIMSLFLVLYTALCTKSNGSCDIKDFGTLSLIFSTTINHQPSTLSIIFLHPKWGEIFGEYFFRL